MVSDHVEPVRLLVRPVGEQPAEVGAPLRRVGRLVDGAQRGGDHARRGIALGKFNGFGQERGLGPFFGLFFRTILEPELGLHFSTKKFSPKSGSLRCG